MIQPKNPPWVSGTQFVAIVVLTIAVFLIIDFGRRTTTGYYIAQAEKQLKADIQAELTQRAELEQRREYVMSDEYVEKWAREQAHMVRSGDRPLILITPPVSGVQMEVTQPRDSPTVPNRVPNWHHWWELFLDTKPPTVRTE